jgi:hypothetical protein
MNSHFQETIDLMTNWLLILMGLLLLSIDHGADHIRAAADLSQWPAPPKVQNHP